MHVQNITGYSNTLYKNLSFQISDSILATEKHDLN